jgi:hypothetical protein
VPGLGRGLGATAASKGSVPFDGTSVPERYPQAGAGLILLSDNHVADDCTTNRIFEICAAGALAIAPRMPWHERTFGDALRYFTQEAGDNVVADEIAAHMDWIAAHPAEARVYA